MKENFDEGLFPNEKEKDDNNKNNTEEKKEGKEEKEKNNQFEIISEDEAKDIIKKDHEIKKNIMYALNKDENIFSNSDEDSDKDYLIRKSDSLLEFLSQKDNKFRNINPLRMQKPTEKMLEDSTKSRTTAIKELVTNLKTQYIIFNIRDFIRQYHLNANPFINERQHKIIKIVQNLCLYLYGIIMLFEKPWFCYKGTTIPLPSSFTFIDKCEEQIEFSGLPFIYTDLLRVIEIFQTVVIAVTQLIKYKSEIILKKTNIGLNRLYNAIQIILYISLGLSLIDLIWALIAKKFPIINFMMRPFIYIYMLRRLRLNWISILKVLWKTKIIYFILLINIITFSCIGYFLFNRKDGYFESLGESFLQLYILLTTCNFPDIMFDAMKFSKFAIIYFIVYISINIFIILSFLKSLYTNKYYSVNKKDCIEIIKNIFQNSYNQHIFNGKKFNYFLLQQKKLYSLSKDEFNNLLVLFNLYNKNSDILNELSEMVERNPEREIIDNNKYGKYLLDSYIVEITINVLCIITTIFLISDNYILLVINNIISICILFESLFLICLLGIKRFVFHHMKRFIFHIFNISVVILIFILYYLKSINDENKFSKVFSLFKIFTSLRTIRVFLFLDKFKIIQNIYSIMSVSKEMLYRNLTMLNSLFILFSTLSMLLTGGSIKKNNFDNVSDIPKNYVRINFNDFGSSYITCFCLLMINNINIIVNSLSYNLNHKMFYKLYFATFYFFSTLILINIIQTLLLEMYLISDNSTKDKKDKKTKNENINEFSIN